MIGLPDRTLDSAALADVRRGWVGSLIMFEKNIPLENSYVSLKKINWTYQQAAPVPLFIAIDQEGGRVNRLKEKYGFPPTVSAAALGSYPTLDSVHFYSGITAATLAGLGFNVNFAPVVDLAVNPDNPVIAKVERSFSADPDKVTACASAFIDEHRKLGIVTVLKHFPGHGSSTGDTHLGMADVSNTWTPQELIPYQRLIRSNQVDAIMTAHIVNRRLDTAAFPGTLSSKMIDGLLRDSLGYRGVVFSDDMQMQAITKYYGLGDAIRLAIDAGVDILIFSNNIPGNEQRTVDTVHDLIRQYVKSGAITASRIDESYRRVMQLKQRRLAIGKTTANALSDMEGRLEALEEENVKLNAALDSLKNSPGRTRSHRKSHKKR